MNKNRFKIAVNNILKYQKEQDKKMYSEEEVLEIIVKCPYVLSSDVKNWFQKFKNK